MLGFKKTISIFIICGLFLSYFYYSAISPVYATDGGGAWAQFGQYNLKEFVFDTAARVVARLQLSDGLNRIAQQVVQSGRTGRTPAFVQNWRNFITDAEYRGENVFRSMLANTTHCPQIRNDILGMFGVRNPSQLTQNVRTNNLDPYGQRARCTLPAGWSIQNYNNDFAGNGGWEALARLAQPQNNFYGATIMALGELDAQRNLERTADRSETSGNGFTGVRRSDRTGSSCDTPPLLLNSGQCRDSYLACTVNADCFSGEPCIGAVPNPSQASCTFLGVITTPSKIFGEGAASFIDNNLRWLTTTDEFSEVLGNFLGAMVNKLVDYTADSIAGGIRTPGLTAENTSRNDVQACVRACNNTSTGSQVLTCIERCYRGAGADLPGNYDSSAFTSTTTPPGGGGGGGACSGVVGQVANYSGDLQTAINAVNANNPGGIADQMNTATNSLAYLNFVATELQGAGFNATNGVLNGNSNPNSGDLIALWRAGDTYAERYDAIVDAGSGNIVLRTAATSGQYVGDIPFSCVPGSGGGGGGGGTCNNNSVCDVGEDQNTCPADCTPPPGPVCGDNICEAGEDQFNCPQDCGVPLP